MQRKRQEPKSIHLSEHMQLEYSDSVGFTLDFTFSMSNIFFTHLSATKNEKHP